MSDGTPIRVLLVDDHVLFRKGVASLLADDPKLQVVGEADNGADAVEKARDLMPDVILMDVSMPVLDGLETTRRIKAEMPYVRIVMLTASDGDQSLFEAIKSGAQGYLLKNADPALLLTTIKGVMRGDATFSGVMAAKILGEFARPADPDVERDASPEFALTPREREVLALVAEGKSNKEIATDLEVAENTVKNHLKNILEKLHLQNRVQAATFALKRGIVREPQPDRA